MIAFIMPATSLQFVLLVILTLFFWFLVFGLHRARFRLTLVPLYGLISALVVYTHTLSSFGVSVIQWDLFFLVSSTSYFTPLLLGILLIYLFDGVEAARKGLEILVMVSILQVVVVYTSNIVDTTNLFIPATPGNFKNYFWSITAMVVDVAAMSMLWEAMSKIDRLSQYIKVPILMFVVLMVDAFIFVTGVFFGTEFYWDIIKSGAIVRLFLSLLMGVIIAWYLGRLKYSESNRDKPEKIWDILDFRSALVQRVEGLKEKVTEKSELAEELRRTQEVYQLALEGISAGVWEWDIQSGKERWSDRFLNLLGYKRGEIEESYDQFKAMLHPDDKEKTLKAVDDHLTDKGPYVIEYRLKTKTGEYKWFLGSGKAMFDDKGKPVRMVGSIVDINQSKSAEEKLKKEFEEKERLNKLMVDREIKMAEMKKVMKNTDAT